MTQYTPQQIDTMHENEAFWDWLAFHRPGSGDLDGNTLYEAIRGGILDIEDLEDFDWKEYLDE